MKEQVLRKGEDEEASSIRFLLLFYLGGTRVRITRREFLVRKKRRCKGRGIFLMSGKELTWGERGRGWHERKTLKCCI